MGPKLLIVEDDPLVRSLTCEMVSECGFESLEAETAAEALRVLESDAEQIALIITDVRMPGSMDGVQLANFVHEHWPRIRIIVVSGFDDGRRQHLLDGIEFLPKPSKALDVIRRVLDAKQDQSADRGGGAGLPKTHLAIA